MAKRQPKQLAIGSAIASPGDSGENGIDVNEATGVGNSHIPDGGSSDATDLASIPDSGDSGSSTRKRRKRRDAGSKRGRKANTETSQNLESILFSLHTMGSLLLKVPELELTEDESAKLASAIQQVNELYDMPILPPSVMAWTNLAIVSGTIYGPRAIAIINNKKNAEKGEPKVIDFSASSLEN